MGENLDFGVANLLCTEDSTDCFDDLDDNFYVSPYWQYENNGNLVQDPMFISNRSNFWMGFPSQRDEEIKEMVEVEREYMPKGDYLERLRSGDLDMRVRREALDWILKAHTHYAFGPLSFCNSINYLDRFLSLYQLPRDKAWTLQLLAVACFSLGAKMEENKLPLSIELQVGEPKFLFEAITIQRMELLVLSTLKWRMQICTPFSFVEYFLTKINDDQYPSIASISKAELLILGSIKGIDFLEFKASEIAAAVAIYVSDNLLTLDIHKAVSSLVHVEKERVFKCMGLVKDLLVAGNAGNNGLGLSSLPLSPNGVLEAAACLSFKSENATAPVVGSCTNSFPNNIIANTTTVTATAPIPPPTPTSPETKKRKPEAEEEKD